MNKIAVVTLGIAAAGSVGAVARFGLWFFANTYVTARFPVGTLFINLTGAFFLGFLSTFMGNSQSAEIWRLILGTGFLGTFTTYSTMMLETDKMGSDARYFAAASYMALSVFVGLAAVRLGVIAGRALAGAS